MIDLKHTSEEVQNFYIDEQYRIATCGDTATYGTCENGHKVIKLIRCGREWCPVCGEKNSESHNRRISRWLPKVQQIESLGYFVFQLEKKDREKARDVEYLKLFKKTSVQIMKELGYDRGLIRYHWFGDEDPVERGFNPHLNIIVDSGYIDKVKFEKIKNFIIDRMVEEGLITEFLIIRYNYSIKPSKKFHKLNYITRPTFKDMNWDLEMACKLKGFRNNDWWGYKMWNGEEVWSVSDIKSEISEEKREELEGLRSLQRQVCPCCGGKITYYRIVNFEEFIKEEGMKYLRDMYGGYLIFMNSNERREFENVTTREKFGILE